MKFLFEFVAFAMISCVIDGHSGDNLWNDYKLRHGKDYWSPFDSGLQDELRKELFLAQHAQINQHNSENPSFRRELNKFSDMWSWEKHKYLGVKSSMAPSRQFMKSTYRVDLLENRQTLPISLDYSSDSCMPPVKDQQQCGSCWAFVAIAPLEFTHCKKRWKKFRKSYVVLSEQQLLDCDRILDNGCDGGWYTNAWGYIMIAGGSAHQSIYPYNGRRNSCYFWFFMSGARVFRFSYVPADNPVAMQVAVQKYGPLATAFAAVDSFFSYESGVYDDPECDGKTINHGVVIVGWGSLNGMDYWIVRNSWGTDWGLSGYGRIQRGVNKCGIETYPAYVVPK